MARKARTEAERRADAAEDRAIAHSRHLHSSMGQLARDYDEARRYDEAQARLEAQLRYGRTRRRRRSTAKRPKWTGRAR